MDIKLTIHLRKGETVEEALKRTGASSAGVGRVVIEDADGWETVGELERENSKLEGKVEKLKAKNGELQDMLSDAHHSLLERGAAPAKSDEQEPAATDNDVTLDAATRARIDRVEYIEDANVSLSAGLKNALERLAKLEAVSGDADAGSVVSGVKRSPAWVEGYEHGYALAKQDFAGKL